MKRDVMYALCPCAAALYFGSTALIACGETAASDDKAAMPATDASIRETSPEPVVADAGSYLPGEDAATMDAASSCTPHAIGNFSTTWRPPRPSPGACTASELHAFELECLSNERSALCAAFRSAHAACASCLHGSISDTTSAAVTSYDTIGGDFVNLPGCVAYVANGGARVQCGKDWQARLDCEVAACAPGCTNDTADAAASFTQCLRAARTSVCAEFEDAFNVSCDGMADAGATYAPCWSASATTFVEYYRSISALFCGPPVNQGAVSDGGDASR